jgi:glucose-1-phosphate cytidylyltransferase
VIGQRLRAARRHLGDDQFFLASYGDCLTDAPINDYIEDFLRRDAVAAFLCVRPSYTFHVVEGSEDGRVDAIRHVRDAGIWINGGYFIFRREIFDWIGDGEDLVTAPFERLIAAGRIIAYRYNGFWMPMDTLKEMQDLEALWQTGDPPWAIWLDRAGRNATATSTPGTVDAGGVRAPRPRLLRPNAGLAVSRAAAETTP